MHGYKCLVGVQYLAALDFCHYLTIKPLLRRLSSNITVGVKNEE
jgi:hypothetical protein